MGEDFNNHRRIFDGCRRNSSPIGVPGPTRVNCWFCSAVSMASSLYNEFLVQAVQSLLQVVQIDSG